MSESHIGGFHRPVQKLDDTAILFSRLTQGKTKCKRIPYSVRPAGGGTRRWMRTGRKRAGGELPLRGDLIRRYVPPSPCAGKALTNQRAFRRSRDRGLDIGTDRTPHPASASREIGGCHLLLKEKALANPNQRASRRRRDRVLDKSAEKVTAENCRDPGTSSTASGPPVHLAVPENCCGLTLILAVFDRCGKGALAFSATGSARASFPRARGRLWRIPTSVRPDAGSSCLGAQTPVYYLYQSTGRR